MDDIWGLILLSVAIGFFSGWLGSDLVALFRLKRKPKLSSEYKPNNRRD